MPGKPRSRAQLATFASADRIGVRIITLAVAVAASVDPTLTARVLRLAHYGRTER